MPLRWYRPEPGMSRLGDRFSWLNDLLRWMATIWRPVDGVVACACVVLFWTLRSSRFAGDGELIARITEGGKWLVRNELLSQAILQLAFRIGQGGDAGILTVMNAVSCLFGGLAVLVLLGAGRMFAGANAVWPLLLFASSGFLIYACGHTEYYPLLLPVLWLYGMVLVACAHRQVSLTSVCVVFWLGCALHFGMLFALPSLLLLVVRHRPPGSFTALLMLAAGIGLLFAIRNLMWIFDYRVAGLSPAFNWLPLFPHEGMNRYYAFFQWGHLYDWMYAWVSRSWILWPLILATASLQGWRSLLREDRLLLLVYTLGFTVFTVIWHPDLGVMKDWDLFALEAAPAMLLAFICLPAWNRSRSRALVLALACSVSTVLMVTHALEQHRAFPRSTGTIRLVQPDEPSTFILNGVFQTARVVPHTEGHVAMKWISQPRHLSLDGFVVVIPGRETVLKPLPE